ncbi:hypothetical protein ACM7V1_29335 [Pseudomonas aeruginosa]|uniref:hypothetical protein n=1 Tax=Pseudomonas aeruginosa TaxID=287 RepID=UPI000F6D80F4|nr:hypothetical protein [Pseudomonas aeruginosa]VEF98766.1 Uncharacterised protein [Pseudomonas aeruginosa]VEF98833.1 Uncharacterised protein [Pseudomonas aeruginosa]
MSIDWSKAPEGATHWEPRSDKYREAWMKNAADKWFFWGSRREAWIEESGISAEREATFEARPQEAWDGKGLPPVGTVCEWHESDGWAYTESKVAAYTDDGLFVCMQKPGRRPEVLRIDNCEFRPIRTPEQIAAEEREKAISEMLYIYNGAYWPMTSKQFCEILFDAGYRRQEEGK